MRQMQLSTEKQLVEDAKEDPRKFGKLFDAYYQPIFNYVLRRVGETALADELTSNVFFKAFARMDKFEWRGVPYGAWLYRIAGNEVKSHYRGKKWLLSLDDLREMVGFEPVASEDLEEELVQAQNEFEQQRRFQEMSELIRELPVKYQEVIHLRFFEEKSIRQIAEILEKKEGTVKSLLSRGLSKLRDKCCEDRQVKKGSAMEDLRVAVTRLAMARTVTRGF